MSPAATGGFSAPSGAAAFFLLDDLDDLVVAALGGERERGGGAAVRPDTLAGIGAMLHQESSDLRASLQHSVVKGPMLVVLRDVQMH